MVRNQDRRGPGIVEWSLPDDEVGQVQSVVEVRDADLDDDDAHATWCPTCGETTPMRDAVTPDGRRFDLCDGCGLLWHVDRRLGRAEAHRVAVHRPPSPAEAPVEQPADVRVVASAPQDGPDAPAATADPAPQPAPSHPMAS